MITSKISKGYYQVKTAYNVYTIESGEQAGLKNKKEWLLTCGTYGDVNYYKETVLSKKEAIKMIEGDMEKLKEG